MVIIPLVLLVFGGIGYGIWQATHRPAKDRSTTTLDLSAVTPLQAERIFLYVLATVALPAAVFALIGLCDILLAGTVFASSQLLSAADSRSHASYLLALLVVALPVWALCWRAVQKRSMRPPVERESRERQWALAALFVFSALVALYNARIALSQALLLIFGTRGAGDTVTLVQALIAAVAWAGVWAWQNGIDRRAHAGTRTATPHALAVYAVWGVSLGFLTSGALSIVSETLTDIDELTSGPSLLYAGTIDTWLQTAAWMVSGAALWVATATYRARRLRNERVARIYTNVVFSVTVPVAILGGITVAYELVRRVLGYTSSQSLLSVLRPPLTLALVAGAIWAYHAWREYSTPVQELTRRDATGAFPVAGAAMLLVAGMALIASGVTSVVWIVADRLNRAPGVIDDSTWWRDRASLALVAAGMGGLLWWQSYGRLTGAVRTQGPGSPAARTYGRMVGFVALAAALLAAGFGMATLWLLFERLLGVKGDPGQFALLFRALSGCLIAASFSIYHVRLLRATRVRSAPAPAAKPALVFLGNESAAVFERLRVSPGWTFSVAGYLRDGNAPVLYDTEQAAQLLRAAAADARIRGAVVFVEAGKAAVIAYNSDQRTDPAPEARPVARAESSV